MTWRWELEFNLYVERYPFWQTGRIVSVSFWLWGGQSSHHKKWILVVANQWQVGKILFGQEDNNANLRFGDTNKLVRFLKFQQKIADRRSPNFCSSSSLFLSQQNLFELADAESKVKLPHDKRKVQIWLQRVFKFQELIGMLLDTLGWKSLFHPFQPWP